MSATQALLTALLAGGLAHAPSVPAACLMVMVWLVCWAFTRDPLPDAIRRGLDAYAKDYRK